jgi:hypothetical protein
MRYVVVFIAALFVVFASCKKKQKPLNCYVCEGYDLRTSNIYALCIPYTHHGTDTICNWNDALIYDYVQKHNHTDTVLLTHDTLVLQKTFMDCGLQ